MLSGGKVVAAALAAVALQGVAVCSGEPAGPADRLIDTSADDAAMNAAIKQAQATLPAFWTEFNRKSPGVTDHAVKLAMTGQDGYVEYIWAYVVRRDRDEVVAELANEPEHLRGLARGSEVRVSQSLISDWSYLKDGALFGHYTTRVLLPRMSPEERGAVKLSPAPLEPNAP